MPLDEVGYYAGHASLDTTTRYIHPNRSELARHIRKATGRRDQQIQRLIEETQSHE